MTAHDRLILDNPGAGWPADMVEEAEARHDAERRAVLRPVEEHEAALSDSDSDDSADGGVVAVWAALLAFVVLFWVLVIHQLWNIDFVAPTTLDTARHGGIEATMAWAEDRQ